jgi:hypothetical protein
MLETKTLGFQSKFESSSLASSYRRLLSLSVGKGCDGAVRGSTKAMRSLYEWMSGSSGWSMRTWRVSTTHLRSSRNFTTGIDAHGIEISVTH